MLRYWLDSRSAINVPWCDECRLNWQMIKPSRPHSVQCSSKYETERFLGHVPLNATFIFPRAERKTPTFFAFSPSPIREWKFNYQIADFLLGRTQFAKAATRQENEFRLSMVMCSINHRICRMESSHVLQMTSTVNSTKLTLVKSPSIKYSIFTEIYGRGVGKNSSDQNELPYVHETWIMKHE